MTDWHCSACGTPLDPMMTYRAEDELVCRSCWDKRQSFSQMYSPSLSMRKLRWRNLTKNQIEWLEAKGYVNGCGASKGLWWWVRPPTTLFKASCRHHDFNYLLGGTEEDREKADKEFRQAMKADIKLWPWATRWYGYARMAVFFAAVRKFGGSSFRYADTPMNWYQFYDLMHGTLVEEL